MKEEDFTKYEMWHDEYQDPDDGTFTHGIFLIPEEKKQKICEILDELRSEFDADEEIKRGFGGALSNTSQSKLLRNHLATASHLLKVKRDGKTKLFHEDGGMKYTGEYKHFMEIPNTEPFHAKLGMLVVPNNHSDMFSEDYAKNAELTMRFAMKGLCHWAFDRSTPISIENFYFDGYEHHGRSFNIKRIIGKQDWNDYVDIDPKNISIDTRHRDNRNDNSAFLMDLADSTIGGLYNKIYTDRSSNSALNPLDPIFDRLKSGKIQKNKSSRWHKSVTVSEVCVSDHEDKSFDFKPIEIKPSTNQIKMDL